MKKLILKKSELSSTGRVYRIPYEQVLNPAQYAAVMHTNGPALVLAGAGTGKTRTLTYRVARLVEDGVDPSSILLLTFTRKAAAEMLRRSSALLDGRCERVAGGTFHSFAFSILRRFGLQGQDVNVLPAERRAATSVMDQADAEDVMNMVRGRFDVAKLKKRFPQKGTLYAMYSRSVNTGTPLTDVIEEEYSQFVEETQRISEVVRGYNEYKRANGLFDYDDLLLYLLAMTKHEEIGPILRKQFRYVMVDEYQDTNKLQHNIILGLAGTNGNVMVVGDDAQSIYSFRGADVRNIHAVPDSFENCVVIRLEHNYRSTQPILDVCNSILRDAPNMFEKELFSEKKEGDQPMLISATNERQQSSFVMQQILELRENGTPLSDIAVLFRSGFLSFDLEIELGKANIPFRKFGGLRFAEAAHVKDLLARVRLTENPRDVISWYRVLLQLPGVGQKTAQMVIDAMQTEADPLSRPENSWGSTGKGASAIANVASMLARVRTITDPLERLRSIADEYRATLEKAYDDHPKRWKDIETVVGIGGRYTTVEEFLADIALDPPTESLDEIDADDGENEFVTLSTIHSAKGLEWNSVFLIWVNEGRLPSARSAESEASLEEERRLLYVACTRAKERLYLTYPAVMLEWQNSDVLGRPSRFLDTVTAERIQQYYLTEGVE
ncbi:MAG TPA: ATP-dependent helicase [Candidatus Didemnitutus sp.]|nr:ATP-dependent helicase [Candidatus Didemnitutus sp.]